MNPKKVIGAGLAGLVLAGLGSTPVEAADSAKLPPCPTEDSLYHGQTCRWNAHKRGNHKGHSYTLVATHGHNPWHTGFIIKNTDRLTVGDWKRYAHYKHA